MMQAVAPRSNLRAGEQPWLGSARFDLTFMIGPALLPVALVLIFRDWFRAAADLPVWGWVVLVLLVDVAHVYATLYRTYLHRQAAGKNQSLLVAIPLTCFAASAVAYSIDALLFWRALAYLAVFHFIRQQYGFCALYSRQDPQAFRQWRWLNAAFVYAATLYPIVYWHTHLPRHFSWFVEGDFAALPAVANDLGLLVYIVFAVAYVVKEIAQTVQTRQFNWPRNLLLAGTAFTWWVGIITLNSDFAFTMTNVLAHGIPYVALVWLHHGGQKPGLGRQLVVSYLPLFLGFLALLAYLEEGLWDGFIWREHGQIFPLFAGLPQVSDPAILAILVPLLSLPQSTHYVLDGFIWRLKEPGSDWSIAFKRGQ